MEDTERVAAIERAFVTHWSHMGRWPGAALHDEDGVVWYESPIPHLPYNAVISTALDGDAAGVVARVAGRFRERGVPFMWVRRPCDTPPDLDALLRAEGLALVEEAAGMDLDLDAWRPEPSPDGLRIVEADDDGTLADYESLIRAYWDLPEESRALIETMNRYWSGANSPGIRYVAYVDGRPVGKLFLNLVDLPVAAVFGVAVVAEGRGRGVATAVMNAALGRAVELGATRAVLHSSEMAYRMYLRMGFVPRCTIEAYATEAIFTHHH